jgi:hypothetical protein
VIITVCWVVLALLPIDYPNRHWGIVMTAMVVIGVVLLAEWWRWEQKSSDTFVDALASKSIAMVTSPIDLPALPLRSVN